MDAGDAADDSFEFLTVKRTGLHIIFLLTALTAALSFTACERQKPEKEESQLMVNLYIPGSAMTRAETGNVSPMEKETKVTSLQVWAFLSESGTLISYKGFSTGIDGTGLPNSTITRFGLPLSDEMFTLLTTEPRPKVDVYAVANAASAVSELPDESTPRSVLDAMTVNGIGGGTTLTMSVPEAGLPMSGVLKATDVTGEYPVLDIPTLKLTRAISKIRFVFCQQGIPATADTPAEKVNEYCRIMGISFDGTSGGKDCQVGATERLFTTQTFDLGDNKGYAPLSASITGTSGAPLIPNDKLSIVGEPELLAFRGIGNETETAEHYEKRLDAAVSADSQVGPIYLCETDKTISGTITYRTEAGGSDQTVSFSMSEDVFPRNHTWIVFACFVEETMKLHLQVVVLPWEWSSYFADFTTGTVNVIRRFGVVDTPIPTFSKVQTTDGFFDVRFWHTVEIEGQEQENVLTGSIIIATPVGGKIYAIPVPGNDYVQPITDCITVTPAFATIYPNYQNMENGRIEDCLITFQIKCNRSSYTDEQLKDNYIDLHFSVETPSGQFIDLGSESIDYYRFILTPDWNQ